MQFSVAHKAADEFMKLINDPDDRLGAELGEEFVEELPEGTLWVGSVSDWLHLWLLSGIGHRACLNEPAAYINAVALVYAEFGTNRALFGSIEAVPAMPGPLVAEAMREEAIFVSSPEFPVPASLTPAGFEITRLPNKKARRDAIRAFVEHPEWTRYGFHTYRYFPPN